MFNLNDFPDIILLKVFGFLKYGDLCVIKGVCKKWYALTQSQPLVKIVDASDVVLGYHQMDQLVHRLNSSVTCLHVLGTLQKMLLTPMLLRKLEEQCPKLNTLVLEGAFVSKDSGISNVTLLDFPPQIETLSLRKSFFHLEQLILSRTLKPEIKCLDLSYCWCLSNLHYVYLSQLPFLQELYLSNCDSLVNIHLLVERLPNLKVLDLEATKCPLNIIETISATCRQLCKLFLGKLEIFDEQAKEFDFAHLRELCLFGTGLSDAGFTNILLAKMPLNWLNSSNTLVTDTVVEAARQKYPHCNFVNRISRQRNQEKYSCNHFISKIYTGSTSYI